MRVLAFVLVIIAVVIGVWVTGGLITNDFGLAMWLTAAWFGLAGIGCLLIAARSPFLRWPVLGGYVFTVVILGLYLGMSMFVDREVNERVATAAPPAASPDPSSGAAAAPPAQANERLRAGAFRPVAHAVRGTATFIELAEGGRVVTLTDFEVDNGPDLRVYLVAGPAEDEGQVQDFVDLGALKGNQGNQQYEIDDSVDVARYSTVVIWCRAFSVLFARAPTSR